ncbi:MAG: hypothetical protein AAF564_13025 [Bacteroidota bacterium]
MLWFDLSEARGQSQESPLETFGYFQVLFRHDESSQRLNRSNSFSVQQLNLIFQKDFAREWRAFINFQVLNNFSSSRRWGSFDLDEAWVRYRANQKLTLKVGLHVPVFNHLNEIKNRTPLLPYVIRPLIYEESFAEFVSLEEFIPERAFVQANGSFPFGNARVDYATYLGNSPNINSQTDNERKGIGQQTGVDTTTTVLVGGRIGVRVEGLKAGISATRESVDSFRLPNQPSLAAVAKIRIGTDVSFYYNRFSFEGELITVLYDVDAPADLGLLPDGTEPNIDLERLFYYGTLGYEMTERLFVYGSYWYTKEKFEQFLPLASLMERQSIEVFSLGARYSMLQDEDGFDRITLKAQYAYVPVKFKLEEEMFRVTDNQNIHFFGLAISVLF